MVSIQIKGIKDADRLLAVIASSPKKLDRLANRILYKIEREGKVESPVKTGTLRRSIHTHALGFQRGYVATNTDYAIYVHEGARGRKANPFMQRAVDKTEAFVEKELDQFVNEMLNFV